MADPSLPAVASLLPLIVVELLIMTAAELGRFWLDSDIYAYDYYAD